MGKEQVTFWRDTALANMEVLKATYVHHAFSRHTHEGYAIGIIESGVEAFDYLGCAYQAPADTLVYYPSGRSPYGASGCGGRLAISYDVSGCESDAKSGG
ncbi:MAG: AraC family ligand binding domain-containing protein [Leptolyngbyaceae cyanobacterium]